MASQPGRVGRPSLVDERRGQVLDAFVALVAAHGLESVTLDDVARASGVSRAAVRHFVGNRDELVRQSIVLLAGRYETAMTETLGEAPTVSALLDELCGPWAEDLDDDDRAFHALLVESLTTVEGTATMRAAYDRLVGLVEGTLRRDHAGASPAAIRDTAYALVCLVEQHVTMRRLGFPRVRGRAVRAAAQVLVDRLGT